jgi:hypothetical protein
VYVFVSGVLCLYPAPVTYFTCDVQPPIILDTSTTFCALSGSTDCSDDVVGLPGVDGLDVRSLFFTKGKGVVGNATSPRHEIAISTSALIVGEWKLILPVSRLQM